MTKQLPRRKLQLIFIELEPSSVKRVNTALSEAFSQEPGLKDPDSLTGSSWAFDYCPDLEYTKEIADGLQLPWPPLLQRLDDNLLSRHASIPGITTPYLYISPAPKGSLFGLHIEDYHLYSLNLMHVGQTENDALFRLLLPLRAKLFGPAAGAPMCDQWVRHLSTFVPLSELRKAGVKFTMVEQRPGDLIITGPGTYHQGWNTGANMAEAINFASPQSAGFAEGYCHCTDSCKLEVGTPKSLDYYFFHDFASTAEPPIIIDFQSMLPASEKANCPPPPSARSAHPDRSAKSTPPTLLAFDRLHYQCFPMTLITDFYARFCPDAELPNGMRSAKLQFVRDVERVFASEVEFAHAFPQWPDCNLCPDPEPTPPPRANAQLRHLLAPNPDALWPMVCWQKQGHPQTQVETVEELENLEPID
ncbi:MAG: hypothetical protein M1829_002589 [Trizodia sp. TS-e1964]|nr:MAG: hypothetical protein M1829_002589 [Trizodia sp. TS-e1964]